MTASPNPTARPRPARQQFEDGAFNETEHVILHTLRRCRERDEDVLSFEDLAQRAGLPIEECNKTTKSLMRRGTVYVLPIDPNEPRSAGRISVSRVENCIGF